MRAVLSRRVIAGAVVLKTVLSRYLPNPLTYSEALVEKAEKMFVSRLNSISVDSKTEDWPLCKIQLVFFAKIDVIEKKKQQYFKSYQNISVNSK